MLHREVKEPLKGLFKACLGTLEINGLIELIVDETDGRTLITTKGQIPKIVRTSRPIVNYLGPESPDYSNSRFKDLLGTQVSNKIYPGSNAFNVEPLPDNLTTCKGSYILSFYKIEEAS